MRLCTSATMAEPLQKPPLIPFTVRVGQRMRQETKAVVDEQATKRDGTTSRTIG